ncbi:MAG: hypothetical protein WC776_05530 [Patescibacteria group bacterium]|jgi:hypothetical protein
MNKQPARIEFLESAFGNSKGEIVKVVTENEKEIYYYDGFHRWCYVLKSEEGMAYRYIPAGTRTNQKDKK